MSKTRMRSVVLWISLAVIVAPPIFFTFAVFHRRERAYRIACASNLKCIGLGLEMYARGETYPDRLVETGKHIAYQPKLFVCPRSSHGPRSFATVDDWTDYIYVPSLPESSTPDTVVMYCPAGNHQGAGGNVLFADGHVEWFDSEGLEINGKVSRSLDDVIRTIGQQ